MATAPRAARQLTQFRSRGRGRLCLQRFGCPLPEGSLNQDRHLIKACTLVAVRAICTGRAEGARGCVHEIEWNDPLQFPASHIILWVADYDDLGRS